MGVDTAADVPAPMPGAVHIQGSGLEDTTVASIAAGMVDLPPYF